MSRRKMKTPRLPAVVCIVAMVMIILYSAYTIDGVLGSNAPPKVQFGLGTTDRDLMYLQLADLGPLHPKRGSLASPSTCGLCPWRRVNFRRQV